MCKIKLYDFFELREKLVNSLIYTVPMHFFIALANTHYAIYTEGDNTLDKNEIQQIKNRSIIRELLRPWNTLNANEQNEWIELQNISNNNRAMDTWLNKIAENELNEILDDYSFFQVTEFYKQKESRFFCKSSFKKMLDEILPMGDSGIEIIKARNLAEYNPMELYNTILLQALVHLYKYDEDNYVNIPIEESIYGRMGEQIKNNRLLALSKWKLLGLDLRIKKGCKLKDDIKGYRYYSCHVKFSNAFSICLESSSRKSMLFNINKYKRSYDKIYSLYKSVNDWVSLYILEDTFGFVLANSMYEYLYNFIRTKYCKKNHFAKIVNAYVNILKAFDNPIFRLIIFEKMKYPYKADQLSSEQILNSIKRIEPLTAYYLSLYKEISFSCIKSISEKISKEDYNIIDVINSGEEYLGRCKINHYFIDKDILLMDLLGKCKDLSFESTDLTQNNLTNEFYIMITDSFYNNF